ncbi:hypothetical protein ACFHW1_04975 [Micromonospora sp. LOL_014]|uniref:hypothetical protein n=1 Tax=Micromonospora sp. LOL_014 TaxID=3345415 RepID=UPI003A86B979
MADQLATPEDLASLLQQDLDAATADLLLDLATAKVQRAAGGQRIVEATSTAVIDVMPYSDDRFLALPQLPVRSVSSVTLNGVAITDWTLTAQQLWRLVGWNPLWWRPSQVAVTYAHGYTTGSQYLQLARDCTLSLARAGYSNPAGDLGGEAIDDYRAPRRAEVDARMQLTEDMRAAIADAYGTGAHVTMSR